MFKFRRYRPLSSNLRGIDIKSASTKGRKHNARERGRIMKVLRRDDYKKHVGVDVCINILST